MSEIKNLYTSLHNLDLEEDAPIRKDISTDFDEFIKGYIKTTINSKTSRDYTIRDPNRTTINCVSKILEEVLRQGKVLSDKKNVDELADSIAKKLLDSEKMAQKQAKNIAEIQKGSIVQSLVQGEDGYIFIIAKVEHSEWYDVEGFVKQFGIPDKVNVWKSAVMKLDFKDNATVFTSIKCYINTKAKYWTESFLDIQEKNNDSANTKAVMRAFDKVLHPLKELSPKDYYNLKNTVNKELQTNQLINYSDMVSNLLDNYEPASEKVNVGNLKEGLLALMVKNKFDTQFYSDPKEVKKCGILKIPVSSTIDVLIKDPLQDWESSFFIKKMSDGRNYLMISCENPETLRSFPEK